MTREEMWKNFESELIGNTLTAITINYLCERIIEKSIKEAVAKWKPRLEQEPILDKIRAEIEERMRNSGGEPNRELAFNVCLQIIDKYKAESEV